MAKPRQPETFVELNHTVQPTVYDKARSHGVNLKKMEKQAETAEDRTLVEKIKDFLRRGY